jgi:hypothetical protein
MVCSLETMGGKIGSKALKPEEFSRFHIFSSLQQAATTSLRVNLTTSARVIPGAVDVALVKYFTAMLQQHFETHLYTIPFSKAPAMIAFFTLPYNT